MKKKSLLIIGILIVLLALGLFMERPGTGGVEQVSEEAETPVEAESPKDTESPVVAESPEETEDLSLAEDGLYYSKDEVALYIHTYGKLPDNFMTKKEAKNLGWSSGSLEEYAPGKVIGGDRFGNYEGNLPDKRGRTYYECDIDTLGKKNRGSRRIVFSDDGLIYYTDDHYESFELLYGEEEG